ncbi:MAG: DUF58 domain-containing protein [Thermoanaerobaculales bacterium]
MSVGLWRRFLGIGEATAALPPDLGRRVARVQLAAARRIAAPWAGAYRSAFKGQGIEFADVREYVPGDDARTVDWRVTARTGRLAVRRYVEERNRTVLFLLDAGAGILAGSGDRTLLEVAAEVVALVGGAALAGGDRVALTAWSDRRELQIPPHRDHAALLRLVRAVLSLPTGGRPSNLPAALATVPQQLRRAGVLVVLSPFAGAGYGRLLGALARRHELLLVRLWDEHAGIGSAHGWIPARDASGAGGWGSPSSAALPAEIETLRGDVVMVSPRTALAPILGHAFAARARRRCA